MTKQECLDLAKAAVVDRGQSYGTPTDNFNRIARRWRAHLANRFGVHITLDAISVAIMCDDIKTARLEHQPDHADSWIDKCGYAACGADIACK